MKSFAKRLAILVLIAACTAVVPGCSNGGDIAGNSSGTEARAIVGQLVDNTGVGVPGAVVLLKMKRSIVLGTESRIAADSTTTDTQGDYRFVAVPPGEYLIDAQTADTSLVALVPASELPRVDTMRAPAIIYGKVSFPLDHIVHVSLAATPYTTIVKSDSAFVLNGVPSGTYTLVTTIQNRYNPGDQALIHIDTVHLASGSQTTVDTIRLTRIDSGSGPLTIFSGNNATALSDLGGMWWTINDAGNGGTSVTEPNGFTDLLMVQPGRQNAGSAAHIAFTFGKPIGWAPYVGIGNNLGKYRFNLHEAIDLSNATTLTFWLKGTGSNWYLRVEAYSDLDFNSNRLRVAIDPVPAVWTQYTVSFTSDIVNPSYPPDDPRNWNTLNQFVTVLLFQAVSKSTENTGELWVDDVVLNFR